MENNKMDYLRYDKNGLKITRPNNLDEIHIEDNSTNYKLVRDEYHYFRDIYDDLIQLIDLTETYRDTCSGMLDIYLSSIGNRTNDVMKFLTMFSTIFIPLTFMAGVYGMNFEYLPELKWKYGYLGFWIISLIVVVIMIRFFKKKKWM